MAPGLLKSLTTTILLVFLGSQEGVCQGAIRSLHISTDIVYRFATTTVRSVIVNTRDSPDDVIFLYHLPRESFVSNFTMTINGMQYSSRLEGIEAKRLYRSAKDNSDGQWSRVRNTNTFKFVVNLPSRNEATFELIYNERIKRRMGLHSHVVYLDPGQIVPDLNISVNIVESRSLTIMSVPPIQGFTRDTTSNQLVNQQAALAWRAPNAITVTYTPNQSEQRAESPSGITGKFIVNFDVSRTSDAGQLQVVDGYFIHYFAPAGYRPLLRRVVFVLDVSGSMKGDKITQLQSAMTSILNELQDSDMFNIIVFSSGVTRWQRSLVAATRANKDSALRWFRQDVTVDGLTNINDALTTAVSDIQTFQRTSPEDKGTPYILFLTDGDPTAGETDNAKILQNIRYYNTQRYSIYSVGFGSDVKIPFLRRISFQNGGFARKIYVASDASLQLQGFFNEISSPLLSDIKISYTGNTVDESTVTKTDYNLFFNGSEIFVTGKLRVPTITGITATVHASSLYGPLVLSKKSSTDSNYGLEVPSVTVLNQNIEKMWAYSIIKDTVRKAFESDSNVERATLRRRTRDLSLRYNILSPATVLVAPSPGSAGEVINIFQADSPNPARQGNRVPGNIPQPGGPGSRFPQPGQPGQPGQPRQPEPGRPGYPKTPEYPSRPEQPQPGRPNQPKPQPGRPERLPRPEHPERPSPSQPQQPGQPARPEQERPVRPQPGYPSRPEEPGQQPRPGSPGYRPEQPGYPKTPEQPSRSEQEMPGTPQPDYPDRPNTPQPGQPSRPGYPQRPRPPPQQEYPDPPTLPDVKNEQTPRPGFPYGPSGPQATNAPTRGQPTYPGRPEENGLPFTPRPSYPQPGVPGSPGQPERPQPGQPERPQPGQPETPQPGQPGRPQPGRPERPGYPERSGHPEKPHWPGSPDAATPSKQPTPAPPSDKRNQWPLPPERLNFGADSDPHIIMDIQNIVDEFLCFDLFGEPGDIFQLLNDPVLDVTVNAEIIPRRDETGAITHTYFGRIGVVHEDTNLDITPYSFQIDEITHKWDSGEEYENGNVKIHVGTEGKLQIKIGNTRFMIYRHVSSNNRPLKTAYLGFYLLEPQGLSSSCGGIMGEFVNLRAHLDVSHRYAEHHRITGHLIRMDGRQRSQVIVHPGRRLNMASNKKVKCWHVRNSGRGMLQKRLKDYLVPNLFA